MSENKDVDRYPDPNPPARCPICGRVLVPVCDKNGPRYCCECPKKSKEKP